MPKNKIILSIVFPLLNASEDIPGAFDSIKSQTGINKKKVEIVIVNDGSDDTTVEQVQAYKGFKEFADVKILHHKKRMGLSKTRLDGAEAASGKFITFIDKKTRPDENYISELLGKKRNIVIGNAYMDKNRSVWDALLASIRERLYFPYFNHYYDDIELSAEVYEKFKTKGGGNSLLVLRDYFLRVARDLKKGKDVSDDSMLMSGLVKIEPIYKAYSPKQLYLNRVGFKENILHVYNRGPKFVDYYIHPGTRFFPPLIGFILIIFIAIALIFLLPKLLLLGIALLIVADIVFSLLLADNIKRFFTYLVLLPTILFSFLFGIIKGLVMKLFRRY